MDHNLQDDFFDDDDGFDDLPTNTLDELEHQARVSTSQLPSVAQAVFRKPRHPPSSDYGFDDEDVIDLDAQPAPKPLDEATQREHWRQQRYGAPALPHQYQSAWSNAQRQQGSHNEQHVYDPATDQNGVQADRANGNIPKTAANELQQNGEVDVESLKVRILELEQERLRLQKSAEDARSAALAKAGEISIVRANHDKAANDFERRIVALQSSHAQENAKAKADLEAARRDREKVETNNKFLEHDLAQEAERARNIKRTLRDGNGNAPRTAQGSPLSTPRKNKALAFRDGFDDNEVMLASPSKVRDRSKPNTPKAGAKRKRVQAEKSTYESPSLSFVEPHPGDDGAGMLQDASPKLRGREFGIGPDHSSEKFEFMQRILNHRSDPDRERSLEILTRYSIPPTSGQSLSAIIYDNLAFKSFNQNFEQYRLQLCDTLMSLWSQCLDQSYHDPLYDLTELLQYVLIVSPTSLSTSLISRLVPLCQTTADLIALPRAKASRNANVNRPPSLDLRAHIDPLHYLSILHLMAINCESQEDLKLFWSTVEFDFILLVLHKAQPVDQMIEMLQLLFTSILDDTFGAIAPSHSPADDTTASANAAPSTTLQAKQQKMESDILDRLTVLLFETPQPQTPQPTQPQEAGNSNIIGTNNSNPQPPSPETLLPLRTTVLTLLRALSQTPHGGHHLSTHRLAIPRLVRFLHESLLNMYAYFPTRTHAATTACVNATVLLLAHLDADFGPAADIRGKLAAAPGGLQRWLVCLSRVAFAEGVGAIEGGLLPEARDAAHRVLDEMLSPEEGEGVLGVFCSGR